jgi:hypothetical protein
MTLIWSDLVAVAAFGLASACADPSALQMAPEGGSSGQSSEAGESTGEPAEGPEPACTTEDASTCPAEAPACSEEGACIDLCDDLGGRWEHVDRGMWFELIETHDTAEECWLSEASRVLEGTSHDGDFRSACVDRSGFSADDRSGGFELQIMTRNGYAMWTGTIVRPCTHMDVSWTTYDGTEFLRFDRVLD